MWRSSYHRISDDSVSSFGGHKTGGDALAEAKANMLDPDIDSAWVRDPDGTIVWIDNPKAVIEWVNRG